MRITVLFYSTHRNRYFPIFNAVAKDQLLRTLREEESGVETVIELMNARDAERLKKILKTFNTPDELEKLHVILTEMRRGDPQKERFDSYRDEIDSLNRNGA